MGATGRTNKVILLCRDMKLQIQKPFFKRVGDSIDFSQIHNFIVSLSLSPKLAAFIRYKLTSFLFFKLEHGHGKSVILKLLNCTFVVRL